MTKGVAQPLRSTQPQCTQMQESQYKTQMTETSQPKINSQPQSKGGRAFIVTETSPYGQLYNTHLYIPNPSAVSYQSQWALVNPQNFKQLAISTHHPNGQQELRILVEPDWVNNTGGDQSIVTFDCTHVAKADLSRQIHPPEDWNHDLSSLSNPRWWGQINIPICPNCISLPKIHI